MEFLLADPLHLVIQGEGKNIGKKMILLRLFGCNVQCPECDTLYSWKDKNQSIKYSLEELEKHIRNYINTYHIHHILITGGEPALWEKKIYTLIEKFINLEFEVETSGYSSWEKIKSNPLFKIQFNISPKIGNLKAKNNFPVWDIKILDNPPHNYIIKIVVNKKDFFFSLQAIETLIKKYSLDTKKIYLMPMGKTREEILKESEFIIEMCFRYGFEFSPRLHILLFNNERYK